MPTLTFKTTEEEAVRIRENARRARLSLSAYLRQQALDQPPGKVELVKCERTGAMVFKETPPRPFGTEDVKEMLKDFP